MSTLFWLLAWLRLVIFGLPPLVLLLLLLLVALFARPTCSTILSMILAKSVSDLPFKSNVEVDSDD